MKKFLSVFIPVILLTATAGVYVVNHYCMITGKTTANNTCCSRCSDDCCKKDIKVVRLTIESIKQSDSKILSVFDFAPVSVSAFSFPANPEYLTAVLIPHPEAPLLSLESLRITVLRI